MSTTVNISVVSNTRSVNVASTGATNPVAISSTNPARSVSIAVSPEVLARTFMEQTKTYRDEVFTSMRTIYVSATAPVNPQENQLWLDISI